MHPGHQRADRVGRTEDLDIDARKALRIVQVRQVTGWRTRTDEPNDVRVARLEATRLARQILDLRTHAKANERQLRDLVLQVAPDLLAMRGVGPVTAAVVIVAGPTAAGSARRQRSPPSQAPARSRSPRATPSATASTAEDTEG